MVHNSFSLTLVLGAIGAYLIGSISFALIAGRVLGRDIRKEGSRNAGATNVFRVLGWKAAVPVLIADMLKGFLPVLLVPVVVENGSNTQILLLQTVILFLVIIGHAFPLWAGFRGGKGVASAAGGILAIYPPLAPVCLIVFVAVLLFTRYVSLASLSAAWVLPLAYGVIATITETDFSWWLMVFFLCVTLGVTVLHRQNIRRLIRGKETQILRK